MIWYRTEQLALDECAPRPGNATLWLHCTPEPCLQMISKCFKYPLTTAWKAFSCLPHSRWAYQILLLSVDPLGNSVRLPSGATKEKSVVPFFRLLLFNKCHPVLIKLTSHCSIHAEGRLFFFFFLQNSCNLLAVATTSFSSDSEWPYSEWFKKI